MNITHRASLRFLLRHRLQCLLALFGVGLGVAVVIGIQGIQLGARSAFDQALGAVFGNATHIVRSSAGLFPESHLAEIRRALPGFEPTPVISGQVTLIEGPERHTRTVNIVGIDPLTRPTPLSNSGGSSMRLITEPGTVILPRGLADELGLVSGSEFQIQSAASATRMLKVLEILPDTDFALSGPGTGLLVMDIANAQEVLQQAGKLSRIELHTPQDAAHRDALETLRTNLSPPMLLESYGRSLNSTRQLTQAFYTNLDALSFLALIVGGFMVYSTMSFLVRQRQRIYARLRAMGCTRREILNSVALEATALGMVGGALGNGLGLLLANGLSASFTQSLADHYAAPEQLATLSSPTLWLLGFGMAMAVSLAAAVVPAWQAASHPPAQRMRQQTRTGVGCSRLHLLSAAALSASGGALLLVPGLSLLAGFAALGCYLLAAIVLVTPLLGALLGLTARLCADRLPLAEQLALKSAQNALSGLGLAIAALMTATAISIGIGLMVTSFRTAVEDWLNQLLRADLYISASSQGPEVLIDAGTVSEIASLPGVAAVSRVRRLQLAAAADSIRLSVFELPPAARAGFRFVAGPEWEPWLTGDAVFISEPFARRHRAALGDTITLPTRDGPIALPVRGIYVDYASEQGTVAVAWPFYRTHWAEEGANSIGLYLDDTAGNTLLQRIDSMTSPLGLSTWSNRTLRQHSLDVFDRTFRITDALTVLAELIAALGVLNALLALHLDRAREYAVLRACGCDAALMRRSLYATSLFVAFTAVLFAIPVGAGIAWLLTAIINVRSFGWSMSLSWTLAAVLVPVAVAVVAALLASIYPTERALRQMPAVVLRNE